MALSVEIRKTLGAFHLGVTFDAQDEVLALLGPSGCGKSMTLKCIAGIEKPDEGRILLNGRVLFDSKKGIDLTPQARRVGYLFQQYALFPNMTVLGNIAAGARRLPRAERDAAVAAMITKLRLEGLEDKHPAQLSGGQQQRTALARILVSEPELLLLDEPFSALDSTLKWGLELELLDTLGAFGGTSVYVSHDPDEVARLCSAVCPLTDGRAGKKQSARDYFADVARAQGKNVAVCRVLSVQERELSAFLTLEQPGGRPLRTELPLSRWKAMNDPETVEVCIDPQKIMLLK